VSPANTPARPRWWGGLVDFAAALGLSGLLVGLILWDGAEHLPPAAASAAGGAALDEAAPAPRRVRPPAVAGQFYPADAGSLYAAVAQLLDGAPDVGLRGVRAVLVPHAGYVYSGAVAATSFAQVAAQLRDGRLGRVVLLASNHRGDVDLDGVSIPRVTHYAVPGAEVPVDPVAQELRSHPLVTCAPNAHTMHMLEVELPFLVHLSCTARRGDDGRAGIPTIVPMIVGRLDEAGIESLADLLARLDDGRTLFAFSVDLSHYHPAERAERLDQYSLNALLSLDAAALARATTDANQLLMAGVGLARRRGWEATYLTYLHSGHVSGDNDRVVGYGSVAFADPLTLSAVEARAVVAYARQVLEAHVRRGESPAASPELLARHPVLRLPRGVFVTLEKAHQLRGCIGHLIPRGALHDGIRTCAVQAATEDPRFPPVTADELDTIDLSVSVLQFPAPVRAADPQALLAALTPHRDGVILMANGRQSTYLPTVWEHFPEPRQFLQHLCQKGGSPSNCWRDPATTVYRYGSLEVRESQ